jgi:hypothetical protein
MPGIKHYLRGTRHMEGAWPPGTPVNEYGDRITGDEPKDPFVVDIVRAACGIPAEMRQLWHDSHRWTREREHETIVTRRLESGGTTHTVVLEQDEDYALWRRLGYAENVALLALAGCVVGLAVDSL